MGISISQLRGGTRTLHVAASDDPADGDVTVSYRPGAATLELELAVHDAAEPGAQVHALAAYLVAVVDSWDIIDDTGGPYRIDQTSILRLPTPWLMRLFQAIVADNTPASAGE